MQTTYNKGFHVENRMNQYPISQMIFLISHNILDFSLDLIMSNTPFENLINDFCRFIDYISIRAFYKIYELLKQAKEQLPLFSLIPNVTNT